MLSKDKLDCLQDKFKLYEDYVLLNYYAIEGMADWVRIVDRNGIVIYANKTMKKDLGKDIIGKKCYKSIGKSKPCTLCLTDMTIKTGEIYQKEETIDNKIFSIKSSPVIDCEGKIYAAVEVFRDVTREKVLEKKLKCRNDKMSKDLIFAKTLQQNILPVKGTYNNIQIDCIYRPCEMLSGDMFDVFNIDDKYVGIYICDVAGHGVTASMMTMFVRQTMRALKDVVLSPSETLKQLHRRFVDLNLDYDKYFTIFYGIINSETNEFKFSNAGHNCIPIMFSRTDIKLLRMSGYPITSIFNNIDYEEQLVQMKKGYNVLFYTDGITEIRNQNKEEFGVHRVIDIVKQNDKNLINVLENEVNNFKYGNQQDDFAVVLMKIIK